MIEIWTEDVEKKEANKRRESRNERTRSQISLLRCAPYLQNYTQKLLSKFVPKTSLNL